MASRGSLEMQTAYTRQAMILRKNVSEWDRTVRGTGEDWLKSLGRLNAALNQTVNMDRAIDDVMEHFVFLPMKPTANPQDIPFFLSTRLEDEAAAVTAVAATTGEASGGLLEAAAAAADRIAHFSLDTDKTDPVQHLAAYEKRAAKLVDEYEQKMIRF